MHRLGRELGIADHVRALGAQEAIIPLLSAADVFLLPSAQESFGLAALEAMACGVPVVASRVGGLPEVIEDGVPASSTRSTTSTAWRPAPSRCCWTSDCAWRWCAPPSIASTRISAPSASCQCTEAFYERVLTR